MGQSPIQLDNTSLDPQCAGRRYWYAFLMSSLITFFGGIFFISIWRIFKFIFFGRMWATLRHEKSAHLIEQIDNPTPEIGWVTSIKDFAGELISGKSKTGRVLLTFMTLFSIGSLLIYLIDASTMPIESCQKWKESISQQIDLAFNLYFMMYFFIRFIAAQDKLWFWLDLFSIVDFFTIPPVFVSLYLDRNWIGLRFLRVLRLMNIPDILQYLNILKTSNSIRLTHLFVMFISIWLTAAGLVHLVENSSDIQNQYINTTRNQNVSNVSVLAFSSPSNPNYIQSNYFEYGQKNEHFDKNHPDEKNHKYGISYFDCLYFVIVTISTIGFGDITCRSYLGKIVTVLFMLFGVAVFATAIPELYQIVGNRPKYAGSYRVEKGKRHVVVCGFITYATVSNFLKEFLHQDRDSYEIEVVFINKNMPDLELESLFKKNFTQVTFLQGSIMNTKDLERAKVKDADACLILANKDSSTPDNEDEANIMRVISIKNYHPSVKIIIQLLQYRSKMYLLNIPSWDWKRGDDAVCIAELKLGLLAQSCIAPGFSTLMANLFATRSFDERNQSSASENWLEHYLRGSSMEIYTEYLSPSFTGKTFTQAAIICYSKLNLLLLAIETSNENGQGSSLSINPGTYKCIDPGTRGFFIAGSIEEIKRAFYFCETCHKEVTDLNKIKKCKCTDEIVIFGDTLEKIKRKSLTTNSLGYKNKCRDSVSFYKLDEKHSDKNLKINTTSTLEKFDITGMFHWTDKKNFEDCLLNSTKKYDFSNHVIVCVFSNENSPLIGLRNFVLPLRASNFHMDELKKVIFVGNYEFLKKEWETINNFPNVYIMPGSPNSRSCLRALNIQLCNMCVIISSIDRISTDEHLIDKSAILCSLNIKAMNFEDKNNEIIFGKDVPMLTELRVDSNVQFLDQEDEDDPNKELYMSQPFACGASFANSVLDCIMCTAYFNDNALTLIRTLITGGTTPEFEQMLAEGSEMLEGTDKLENRNRPRLSQICLLDPKYSKFGENSVYSELVMHCLSKLDMLCLGVFRCKDDFQQCFQSNQNLSSIKRFVICNPNSDFRLIKTDIIYVLEQYTINPVKMEAQVLNKHSDIEEERSDQDDPHLSSNLNYKSNSETNNYSELEAKQNSVSTSTRKPMLRSYSSNGFQHKSANKQKTKGFLSESMKFNTETSF